MKKMHSKRPIVKCSVDMAIRRTAKALIRDFRDVLDEPWFCDTFYEALSRGIDGIAKIRNTCPAVDFNEENVLKFKALYQMSSIFKRYRFENDLYSAKELEDLSIDKFLAIQRHVATHSLTSCSAFTDKVLRGAAAYVSKVLGPYSDEEHRNLCRFGRRASVGIPARSACEAARWELPLTGSSDQISWFDSEMSKVDCVQEYWINQLGSDPKRTNYQEVTSLKLTLVPKTFKSLRIIMPNTTIGSYMSYGLGSMMRKRLRRNGYDIAKLQMQHRYLAQRGSVHGFYTTADLSSASDTISVELVDRLFPNDWLDVLHRSRIGKVCLPDGSIIESNTFCTMGIGYTFPLQTLVFLSLLKSLAFCLYGKRRHTISVYGDDMIYPSHMHTHVVDLFNELGFIVNIDKTYNEGWFRESCGGDYYHGVDVRPFQPQNGQANVSPKAYEAILYKFINGLLARWTEYEVSGTLRFLLSEIGRVAWAAKVVPVDFPDDSGIKVSLAAFPEFLKGRSDVLMPKHVGNGVYRFSFLRLVTERREERRHDPYLWLRLRGRDDDVCNYDHHSRLPHHLEPLQSIINDRCGVLDEQESALIWERSHHLTTRLMTGRRVRRLLSYVTISNTGKYMRQSGYSLFEDRRPPA